MFSKDKLCACQQLFACASVGISEGLYVDWVVRPIYKEKQTSTPALSTPIRRLYSKALQKQVFWQTSFSANILTICPCTASWRFFKRNNVKLSASTVNGWTHQVASQLYLLYKKMTEDILSSDYVQADASWGSVINKDKKRTDKEYIMLSVH